MIRVATPQDAPGIAAIWNPLIRDSSITFTDVEKTGADLSRMIAARQRQGAAFLVSIAGGQVQGFATYGRFRDGPGYERTCEHTVMIAPSARRAGLGRHLLAALQHRAQVQGMHALIGGLSADNTAAIAFHAAMGFHEVGRLPEVGRKFGTWHDLVLMQKLLCPPDRARATG